MRWATAQDNRTLWLPDAIVAAMSRDPAAFGLVATDYGRLPHVHKERRSFHWSVDTVLAAHGDGKLGHLKVFVLWFLKSPKAHICCRWLYKSFFNS